MFLVTKTMKSPLGLRRLLLSTTMLAGLAIGCTSGTSGKPGGDAPDATADGRVVPSEDPGTSATITPSATRASAITAARSAVAASAPNSATTFLSLWKTKYVASLGYDPLTATNMSTVQASALKLNQAELDKLGAHGFVVSARQAFPTFFYGYKAIYAEHLPLFISADSILHAVHRSYDLILSSLERSTLIPALGDLLKGMHLALAQSQPAGTKSLADADLFLTVARKLLQPIYLVGSESIMPQAGASAARVDDIVAKARAGATDIQNSEDLFGLERVIDWSQFTPRGHYAGDSTLESYFRAMIWLGRTDMRLIAQNKFYRRQFDVSLQLALLLDQLRLSSWEQLDGILQDFAGESDNMTVRDFDRLRTNLGDSTIADLVQHTDQELGQAIADGDFGIQRIASQILFVPPLGENAPLDRAFLFFGQRYVLDSEVLSNVVFDRVLAKNESDRRMMPDPLDVAFAALANTHAAMLLKDELAAHSNYPAALHQVRLLADQHEPAFWDDSLYNAWLGTLRAMSPPGDQTTQDVAGMPAITKTEPWSRRVLGTQLASWAELRHDTLLYAKQSYTGVPTCEFPDAYVDPYPAVWRALGRYAGRGTAMVARLPSQLQSSASAHFSELSVVASRLEDMANRQLTGQAFTAEQLAWVNEAVALQTLSGGCTTITSPSGWYARLFVDRMKMTEFDPTIADVHTNPAASEILHAGTGGPRLLVMTAETCTGPKAYVGLSSSYYQQVTTGFQRLTDAQWASTLNSTSPPVDVPWMTDLIAE